VRTPFGTRGDHGPPGKSGAELLSICDRSSRARVDEVRIREAPGTRNLKRMRSPDTVVGTASPPAGTNAFGRDAAFAWTMVQLATWMILVVLLGAVTEVRASLALGADEQAITARYGAPAAAVRPDGTAVYSWPGWAVEIRYLHGKVGTLTFRKDEPLQEADLATLLEQNGTREAWRELPASGGEPRRWVRADDAKVFGQPISLRPLLCRQARRRLLRLLPLFHRGTLPKPHQCLPLRVSCRPSL
jgi:hypothetical protein